MSVTRAEGALEIPSGFHELLRDFTREVLRTQPLNIYSFGARYFRRKLAEASGSSESESLPNNTYWPQIRKAILSQNSEGAQQLTWTQMKNALLSAGLGLSDVQAAVAIAGCKEDSDGLIEYEESQGPLCGVISSCLANAASDRSPAVARLPWKGIDPSQLEDEIRRLLDKNIVGELSLKKDLRRALLDTNILGLKEKDINAILCVAETDEGGMLITESLPDFAIEVLSTISACGAEPDFLKNSQALEVFLSKALIKEDAEEKGQLQLSHFFQFLGDLSLKELGLSTVEILASVIPPSGNSVKAVDYLSTIPTLVREVFTIRCQPAFEISFEECVGIKANIFFGLVNTAIQCLKLDNAESVTNEQFLSIFEDLRPEAILLTDVHRAAFELVYWVTTTKYGGKFNTEFGFRLLQDLIQYLHRVKQSKGITGKY